MGKVIDAAARFAPRFRYDYDDPKERRVCLAAAERLQAFADDTAGELLVSREALLEVLVPAVQHINRAAYSSLDEQVTK